jgi:glyoxylase-like metal-dependent hydrolase (beta-lactamase superfamily II)
MEIIPLFDADCSTLTYIVWDRHSKDAVVIDPVLNYDAANDIVSFVAFDTLTQHLDREGCRLKMILETHVHADHLSAARYLKQRYPAAQLAISSGVKAVQAHFYPQFNMSPTLPNPFDLLLDDNARIAAGSLHFSVLHTPGHTPACASYLFDDALFSGDALLMPDAGTGRCDFPGGSARSLYHSLHERLYQLPPATRVFVGHDYQPGGRPLAWCSSIGAQRTRNIMLRAGMGERDFVSAREARDKSLAPPRLLLPSIKANIRGGHFPSS